MDTGQRGSSDTAAFVAAGVQAAAVDCHRAHLDGSHRATLADGALPADFPRAQFVNPKPVIFTAADGTRVHGQLFASGGAAVARSRKAGGDLSSTAALRGKCCWAGITWTTTAMPTR